MAKRTLSAVWAKSFQRGLKAMTRQTLRAGTRAAGKVTKAAVKAVAKQNRPPPGAGDWIAGVAMGKAGVRRFRLYRPPGVKSSERLPLLVMLHGCGQDAKSFALGTGMNRVAARERFCVLYPEQDRLANANGCWNWFDTRSGRAQGEAELILNAIDQVCLMYAVDRERVAVAGLSAGASMAALLATRHPERFKAVVMHSGIPPGTADSGLSALGAMHGRRNTAPLPVLPATPGSPWPALLVIHGGSDRIVSSDNGYAAAQVWADAAGARARPPRSVQRGKRYPMTVTDYRRGSSTAATLVDVARLGHAWSGGAAKQAFSDAQGPDASRMVWAFAAKQFRR